MIATNLANMSDVTTPLGVFLVKSDSSEEKLLFRFPYVIVTESKNLSARSNLNKYALVMPSKHEKLPGTGVLNDHSVSTSGPYSHLPAYTELASSSAINDDVDDQEEITKVIGITDSAFSNLFGVVKRKLCGKKFELKVDNVRFVGHPTMLDNNQCFHIVFALKANAPHDVVKCYHELSQNLAVALHSEERRCRFFSEQSRIMISCHDEISQTVNGTANGHGKGNNYQSLSPYELIIQRSKLAENLRDTFNHLLKRGVVNIRVNRWINVNFCLPQKVHRKLVASDTAPPITPANIHDCLVRLRPYHTFLLLVEISTLLAALPYDVSPSFVRLIKVANPLKNMLDLSADANISLGQTFYIVAQLIYWGKATIIFPLCETNVYMLHPSAPTDLESPLVGEFEHCFPGESLIRTLSLFSLGVSLSQLKNPMDSADQQCKLVQMIIWMLRKRLLLQFHTYVVFVPLLTAPPVMKQRLSFTQSNPSNERATSTSADLNDNTSTMGSSYQSETSMGTSPMSPHLNDFDLQTQNNIRNELDMEKPELILKEIGLAPEEIHAIMTAPAADNVEDVRLFSKLCSYFDGHHHIEDIMYYENLRRSQILTLIDKFRDVLLVYQFEDTTVDKLQPYNVL
ncbi:hypothetical protein RDWZM_004548 [Blomia tropicalis]|uniref:GATOR complex protein NPRL3 n=1 Tax=Blomia tropicalis TaxID=40697 RepID=A0A9Q0RLH9_BLOTA|nr:Nitrogen permease regulator-like 3 [Blomia tropicalis]KAJ6218736.1 hypothetical protein RDWZM_004548 [Blomia tropicalis]